ncbi:MAG: response regulator transcription factor [Actinomycetaceae bacterium]|nr:response regulator transcription factor [Actinomycetaceae bacterium]
MPNMHSPTLLPPKRVFIDKLPPATIVLATAASATFAHLETELAQCHNIRLLASTRSLMHAISLTMTHRPDILLIACHTPDKQLTLLLSALKNILESLAIILCLPENYCPPATLTKLCAGILPSPHTATQLSLAIEAASCGHTLTLSPTQTPIASGQPSTLTITSREHDVLKLLCQGLANKEIARHLFLSESTIKNHTKSLKNKLHVTNRTTLALAAIQHKLV